MTKLMAEMRKDLTEDFLIPFSFDLEQTDVKFFDDVEVARCEIVDHETQDMLLFDYGMVAAKHPTLGAGYFISVDLEGY